MKFRDAFIAFAVVLSACAGAQSTEAQTSASAEMDFTSKLTPDNATFVMVDFLEGFIPGINTIEPRTFRRNAEAYARVSEIFDMPTIMLGDEGGFRGDFLPEVVAHTGHAQRIERHVVSAWDEPAFREAIEAIGRKKIVLGGPSIDICTLQLALDLKAAGYEPYVVADVSGSDTELNELTSIMRLQQAGIVVTNWGSIASELMVDWNSEEGEAIGMLYQEYSAWGRRF